MPVYEYKCEKCGREFEFQQRISEDPLTDCILIDDSGESCNGKVFRKISKNVGLMFKGSGFYLTDYANKKSSTPKTENTPPKPDNPGKSGTEAA